MPDSQSFAIIPAAGRSLRMGTPKLLLPWGNSTVIEHTLQVWQHGGVSQIVVVLHPDDRPLADVCRRLGVHVVAPAVPPPQMRDSIQHGLHFVRDRFQPADRDAWLVAPADLPLLSPQTISQVLAAHDPARPRIVVPLTGGKRGHPVLFPWPLAAEVDRLPADAGINRLVETGDVQDIPASQPEVQQDLDTPDDYRRLHDLHNRQRPASG